MDLKFFKYKTLGKPVIMGRRTYESLGKPLPHRLNIVLSANAALQLPEGVLLLASLEEAIKILQEQNTKEAFIIGGGKIFQACLTFIDVMYITRVHATFAEGDVFFPEIDHTHWKLVWQEPHQADEKNKFAYTFQQYERIEL